MLVVYIKKDAGRVCCNSLVDSRARGRPVKLTNSSQDGAKGNYYQNPEMAIKRHFLKIIFIEAPAQFL